MVDYNRFHQKITEVKAKTCKACKLIGQGSTVTSKVENLRKAQQELSNVQSLIEILLEDLN